MEAGYQNGDGKTTPAMALKWKADLLADLTAAAEADDPKRLVVMARSARKVARHLGDMVPSLADEIRSVEALADGWDLAEVMREYYGEDKFEAQVMAGVTPDGMAAGVLRGYIKGTSTLHQAIEMIGIAPEQKGARFPGKTTLEIAAELIVQNAAVIQDREREIYRGPNNGI
jgi:hypothetical protein